MRGESGRHGADGRRSKYDEPPRPDPDSSQYGFGGGCGGGGGGSGCPAQKFARM
jgi:hypothetical protein